MERWLPAVGFEGLYEVSDLGRVRSVPRLQIYEGARRGGKIVRIERRLQGRLLKPGTVKSGHKVVILGRGNSRLVHRLVLEAFVGPRPLGQEACHFDGDPANNVLTNLRWDTRSGNVRDAIRHGTHKGGPKPGHSPAAVLKATDIPVIRRLIASGLSDGEVAGRFGVTRSAIYSIRRGRNWSHITGEAA